jgi:RimJ/RimL family protein N-acetyltransferase
LGSVRECLGSQTNLTMRCSQPLAGAMPRFTLWNHVHWKPRSLSPAVADLLLVRSDQMTVTLREVTKEDLPTFFEHQLDAEATRMAAFPSRDRDAFMAHWARIMSKETNETGILNTILADETVAGNVVYWEAAGEPNIAYWLGKTHWGKGIATAALAQFLTKIEARPVYAHVAKHNFASIRVLQKCGFQLAREDMSDDGEELVMELRSDRCATAANKSTKT